MNYHLYKGTAWTGPFSTEQIIQMLRNGAATVDDYVCVVGNQSSHQIKTIPALNLKPPTSAPPPIPTQTTVASSMPDGAVYKMKGVGGTLVLFEDKLEITPEGAMGLLFKGFQGSKTIPYFSISSIQFKKSGFASGRGYLRFTISGGVESKGGLWTAGEDENAFMFADQNELALEIKNYIEGQMQQLRFPQQTGSINFAEELEKLNNLRQQGILSDQEFQDAKSQILKSNSQRGRSIPTSSSSNTHRTASVKYVEPSNAPANPWIFWILCLLLGGLGLHRFYSGKKNAWLQLITLGGLGIWSLIDLFVFLNGKFKDGKDTIIPNPSPMIMWPCSIVVTAIFVGARVKAFL